MELLLPQEQDFELNDNAGRWHMFSGVAASSLAVTNTKSFSGTKSFTFSNTAASHGLQITLPGYPGYNYTVTLRIFTTAATTLYTYTLIRGYRSDNTISDVPWAYQNIPANTWTEFSVTRNNWPADVGRMQCLIYVNSAIGTVTYVDNLSVTAVDPNIPAPTSAEIVTKRFTAHARGRAMELNMSGAGTGVIPEVHEVTLEFYARSR